MKRFITTSLSALLLSPVLALAQEEQPVEVVEEQPAEAPAEEAAPAEQAGDPALAQDMAAQETSAEEPEAEPTPGEGTGYIDVYYLPTSVVDVTGLFDESGDGMGGRAQYQFWKFVAASAEYTYRKFDDADTDVTDTRLGLGVATQNNSGATAGLFLQYEKVSSDFDDIDGYALHARWSHPAYEWLRFYVDLGYGQLDGDVEEYTSREFNGGLLFTFGSTGLFADWRRIELEGKDFDAAASAEDVRVGARLSFGG
jgi:opacity protein-like surface antigen